MIRFLFHRPVRAVMGVGCTSILFTCSASSCGAHAFARPRPSGSANAASRRRARRLVRNASRKASRAAVPSAAAAAPEAFAAVPPAAASAAAVSAAGKAAAKPSRERCGGDADRSVGTSPSACAVEESRPSPSAAATPPTLPSPPRPLGGGDDTEAPARAGFPGDRRKNCPCGGRGGRGGEEGGGKNKKEK